MMKSLWYVFRPVFVLFSLYLLGDVFYRWDGFSYYGSFPEFLPAVGLVSILWAAVSVITALLLWFFIRIIVWISSRLSLRITAAHVIIFITFMVILPVMFLMNRTYDIKMFDEATLRIIIVPYKGLFLSGLFFSSLFLTWLLREKADKWINMLQERITPLLWLFIAATLLSCLVVANHTLLTKSHVEQIRGITAPKTVKDNRPNIIFVMFDAMNAKDMSVYGYERETTPFVNKWARQASVFIKAQSSSNCTAPATASLMTGKRVWTHKRYSTHGLEASNSSIENIGLVLKENGYYNMAFIVNPIGSVKAIGVSDGFQVAPGSFEFAVPASLYGYINKSLFNIFGDKIPMYDWIIKGDFVLSAVLGIVSQSVSETTRPPEIVFSRYLSLFDNGNITEPYFAYIHLLPPHFAYLPPKSYKGMFDISPDLRSDKSQNNLIRQFRSGHEYTPEMLPYVNMLRARYDEYIRYCDDQFRDFIALLNKKGMLNNTVIILTSDHGESFSHGIVQHATVHLYEELTNIPLIIKEPGQSEGHIIRDVVEQIDIPATILDMAKIPQPSWVEGRSLLTSIRGGKLPLQPAYSMYLETNENLSEINKGTIAVWDGDYKLVNYLEDNRSMLFNLKNDPDEMSDLFNREQETGQRLLMLIKEILRDVNGKIVKE